MIELKEVELPSGAKLHMNLAPFAVARNLYQAILEEMARVSVDTEQDMFRYIKDFLCFGFASKKIEAIVWECFKSCTYNKTPITENTFEPETARQDYIKMVSLVTLENTQPFLKSLFAEYRAAMRMTESTRA